MHTYIVTHVLEANRYERVTVKVEAMSEPHAAERFCTERYGAGAMAVRSTDESNVWETVSPNGVQWGTLTVGTDTHGAVPVGTMQRGDAGVITGGKFAGRTFTVRRVGSTGRTVWVDWTEQGTNGSIYASTLARES